MQRRKPLTTAEKRRRNETLAIGISRVDLLKPASEIGVSENNLVPKQDTLKEIAAQEAERKATEEEAQKIAKEANKIKMESEEAERVAKEVLERLAMEKAKAAKEEVRMLEEEARRLEERGLAAAEEEARLAAEAISAEKEALEAAATAAALVKADAEAVEAAKACADAAADALAKEEEEIFSSALARAHEEDENERMTEDEATVNLEGEAETLIGEEALANTEEVQIINAQHTIETADTADHIADKEEGNEAESGKSTWSEVMTEGACEANVNKEIDSSHVLLSNEDQVSTEMLPTNPEEVPFQSSTDTEWRTIEIQSEVTECRGDNEEIEDGNGNMNNGKENGYEESNVETPSEEPVVEVIMTETIAECSSARGSVDESSLLEYNASMEKGNSGDNMEYPTERNDMAGCNINGEEDIIN